MEWNVDFEIVELVLLLPEIDSKDKEDVDVCLTSGRDFQRNVDGLSGVLTRKTRLLLFPSKIKLRAR